MEELIEGGRETEKGWGGELGSELITIFDTGFKISQAISA